jgi:hypothetical protein
LQVGVARKRAPGPRAQDDFFQQLNQLALQIPLQESFHRGRDLLRRPALGQGRGDHLVDEAAAGGGVVGEDRVPQVGVAPLDDVPGLQLEEAVARGAVDEGLVALAALVGGAGEGGVALLGVPVFRLWDFGRRREKDERRRVGKKTRERARATDDDKKKTTTPKQKQLTCPPRAGCSRGWSA